MLIKSDDSSECYYEYVCTTNNSLLRHWGMIYIGFPLLLIILSYWWVLCSSTARSLINGMITYGMARAYHLKIILSELLGDHADPIYIWYDMIWYDRQLIAPKKLASYIWYVHTLVAVLTAVSRGPKAVITSNLIISISNIITAVLMCRRLTTFYRQRGECKRVNVQTSKL